MSLLNDHGPIGARNRQPDARSSDLDDLVGTGEVDDGQASATVRPKSLLLSRNSTAESCTGQRLGCKNGFPAAQFS